MTQPICRTDPASEVVNAFIDALKRLFDPGQPCPPDGGGTENVRFFAAEGPPIEVWNAHNAGSGQCKEPFVWVRLVTRYRSENFPTPTVAKQSCDLPVVVVLEIGVARCSVVDERARWSAYAKEAEVSLDDSWRIELALCTAAKALRADNHAVGTDSITPYGPEGGVYAWSALAYVQLP